MNPEIEPYLDQQLAVSEGPHGVVPATFECRYEDRVVPLLGLYEWRRESGSAVLSRFLVTDEVGAGWSLLAEQDLDGIANTLRAPIFSASEGALLSPVHIAKPWGQEIWFTGVESRGVSRIGDGQRVVPLPWYLQAAPQRLTSGRQHSINLLKILDPLPEPVLGDLYFELHRLKQEVYVVTAVDPDAWPEGQGAIRLGFDPEVRAGYASDRQFREAYLTAVTSYRRVRVEIDALIDELRAAEGVGLNDPVLPEVQRRWLATVPEPLAEKERRLRAAMDAFTRLWPLQVGDVVQVPLDMPHALQHGVRTVEFQTPVYERSILSFGQKVLTQDHWDTELAVEAMQLDVAGLAQHYPLASGASWQLDRIVTFDDFVVDRLSLDAGAEWLLERTGEYGLVMCVGQHSRVGALSLGHEQACFLPADRGDLRCRNMGGEQGVLLIATPR